MKRSDPLVSIGMPVYNGDRFLRQALDSILSQTYPRFELLIADNHSNDSTEDICQEYAARDLRIKFQRSQDNLGASRNYNLVLGRAKGKYFRWAPADDVFAQDSLEQCVATLEAHPEVVLCYPKTVLIDESGNTICTYEENLDLRSADVRERFVQALNKAGLGNVIYGLIRTDVLRHTGLMGNYPGADVVLIQELTLYGKFMEIPTTYFYRRKHARAFSSIKSIKEQQEFFDPGTKGRLFMYLWRHYSQHLVSVFRSPLRTAEKARLICIVFRSAVSLRQHLIRELTGGCRQLIGRG